MDAEHDDMNVASSTSSTPVDVSATLKRAKDKFKTTLVSKDDDLIYDIGNLYAFDSHPIDAAALKANHSEYLKSTARDNVQLLLAKLFVLPTQRLDSAGVLALLPPPTMRIPREKPIPKPKAATKWEEYAQLKGIQKKKKGRMVYDEDFGEWRPRWGYKRANNTLDKDNWVIESNSKQTAEDPFLQAAQEKKSRVVKQKKQEDRNKRSAAATQIRSNAAAFSTEVTSAIKVTPGDERRRRERGLIDGTLGKTRHSTASLGRFDPLLAKEKPLKPIRQKFDPVEKSAADESSRNLKMLDRILTPQEGRMNVEKAIKHSKKPKRK